MAWTELFPSGVYQKWWLASELWRFFKQSVGCLSVNILGVFKLIITQPVKIGKKVPIMLCSTLIPNVDKRRGVWGDKEGVITKYGQGKSCKSISKQINAPVTVVTNIKTFKIHGAIANLHGHDPKEEIWPHIEDSSMADEEPDKTSKQIRPSRSRYSGVLSLCAWKWAPLKKTPLSKEAGSFCTACWQVTVLLIEATTLELFCTRWRC